MTSRFASTTFMKSQKSAGITLLRPAICVRCCSILWQNSINIVMLLMWSLCREVILNVRSTSRCEGPPSRMHSKKWSGHGRGTSIWVTRLKCAVSRICSHAFHSLTVVLAPVQLMI